MSSVTRQRQHGPVLVLINHNVSARNALSPAFYAELEAALQNATADPNIAAVVLTGEGGHFCSGGDLRQIEKRRDRPESERRASVDALHRVIEALCNFPKPVIAAVEGAAAGAGLSMALACDLLVVARTAKFSVAYVKVGLTPDGGATAFLSNFVSRQILTELCLTGEVISGERMHALGAANRLVDTGQALDEALALATKIAEGPERAMAHIKHLCRLAPQQTLTQQLELEAQYMAQAQGGQESREGITAFFEKRPPRFAHLRER